VTDPKNPEQGPENVVELDEVAVVEEVVLTEAAPSPPTPPATPATPSGESPAAERASSVPGARPSLPRAIPRAPMRADGEKPPRPPVPLNRPPPPPMASRPPTPPTVPTSPPAMRTGRLNTPPHGRPIARPPSVRPPVAAAPPPVPNAAVPPPPPPTPPVVEKPAVALSEAPQILVDENPVAVSVAPVSFFDDIRAALEPPEPVAPVPFVAIEPPAEPPRPSRPAPPEPPVAAGPLVEPLEPDAHEIEAIRPSVAQPLPLSVDVPELSPTPSYRPPPGPSPVDTFSEAPLMLGGLDDIDEAFRSLELDEQNDARFVARLTAAPELPDALPTELVEGLSIVETREMPVASAPTKPDESNVLLSFDDVFGASQPPSNRAPAEDLEMSLSANDPSVVPEILKSMVAPIVDSEPPLPVRPSDDQFEARLSEMPPEALLPNAPKVEPFVLDVEPPPSDAPSAIIEFGELFDAPPAAPAAEAPPVEPPPAPAAAVVVPPPPPVPTLAALSDLPPLDFVRDSDLAPPPPAASPSEFPEVAVETQSEAPETFELEGGDEGVMLDDEGSYVDDGDDAVIDVEAGEEVEIDAPQADRGAMLAASVTSRNQNTEDTDALFALDPRAEALARAALLVDEADHATSPTQTAEMLALAADLYEGVAGDGPRARELATLAHAVSPAAPAPTRVLRRLEIADGNAAAALSLCEEELAGPLDDAERVELLMLAGELAAKSDPKEAARLWTEASTAGAVGGALAQILAAGVSKDRGLMGDALGSFATQAGGVLAASVDVARARLMEGAEDQAAIQAIRDAVRRDPSDASAWLAMARIGLAQSNAGFFREAVAGIARGGDQSIVSVVVADALRRALDSVLGDPVAPGHIPDAGVAGWLVAHALRDAGGDASAQATYGLTHAAVEGHGAWAAWAGESSGGDAGRFLALRRAVQQRADDAVAAAAASFTGGTSAGAVEAGLRARGASVDAIEADAVGIGGGSTGSIVRAALVAATSGIDAAEAVSDASGESVWHLIARVEAQARTGQRDEARSAFEAVAADDDDAGAKAYALRAIALLGGDTEAVVGALRVEAKGARDPRRAAGQSFLAASLAASAGVPDGGADALRAATALQGDLAAAEIAALHALRGEPIPSAGADLLDAASAGDGQAPRMAAVRAALRRASTDADGAAEAVWRSWSRHTTDAALGALVLRTPSHTIERTVAVARALAESAWAAGRDRPEGAIGAGTFLALALEQAGRHAEASQALARTRTIALNDVALSASEERLWLRAGMFTEVTERAFDRLNAAESDADRITAYERLAEIDRTYRGQVASAVLSMQEILAVAPGHMPSLHALLRFFLEQGRHGEALELCLGLVEHARDPADALAFAHLGSRLASAQADGDPSAGQRFHAAVFARGFTDLRLLNALDADTRRAGDHTRFADVQERLAERASDPAARSVYLARAAQSADALNDHGRALGLHLRAVDALPSNVLARWGAAWSMVVASEAANAADMFEAAGRAAASPEAGAWSWSQASALWRDTVGERTRALAAYREVLERDPSNREAFEAALHILRDAGDSTGELEHLERYGRVSVPADAPQDQAKLYARAAELAEAQGDAARAISQWRSVLAVMPDELGALRSLARLARATSEWNVAADAMIRLAKHTTDGAERIELLYGLGEILDDHIGDPKRAEIAWRRVLTLAPNDARTLQRLMELYRRGGDAAKEADMLQSLVALAPPGPERIDGLLRLASLTELSLNDVTRGHEALEAARRDSPGDLKVLRALRGFHARNGEMEVFLAIADRATVDVRRSADLNPRDLPILERLSEVLEVRGHDDASRIAAAVAVALGSRNDRARALSFDGTVKGIGAAALTADALALLAPPAVTVVLREVLGRSAEVIDQVIPFDPKSFGAERLGAKPHPLRDEINRWAGILGLPAVELYVSSKVHEVCAPIGRSAVLVSASAELTGGARFAVARAMLLAGLSLTLPVRLSGRELALALGALLRQFEPMYRPDGVDARELVELAAKITRAMPRDLHAEIAPFAEELLQRGVKDAETIRAGSLELGDRVALLATGDVAGGIALLSPSNLEAIDAVESVAAVGRLVRVALSERFMEARRIAGADLPSRQ
jgi:tetratricopeptide (TPR) repeat protein